jgi:hypothetical protein
MQYPDFVNILLLILFPGYSVRSRSPRNIIDFEPHLLSRLRLISHMQAWFGRLYKLRQLLKINNLCINYSKSGSLFSPKGEIPVYRERGLIEFPG